MNAIELLTRFLAAGVLAIINHYILQMGDS